MRKLLLLLPILLLFSHKTEAQFFEKNHLYGNLGISGGNYFGSNVGANLILDEKIFINAGVLTLQVDATEKPDDYSAGSGIFGSGDSDITDRYTQPYLSGGYVMKLGSKFRLVLPVGLAIQFRRYATNFTIHETQGTFGGYSFGSSPSHDFEWKKDVSMAFIFNPRIEFLLSHIYGVGVSPLLVLNKHNTFVGLSVNNLIGKIRQRTPVTD